MDTPITLSNTSSSSSLTKPLVIVLDSDSSHRKRRPISWTGSPPKVKRTDSNTTLDNLAKVNNWINGIHEENDKSMLKPNIKDKSSIKSNQKELMFIRCDFNKSIKPGETQVNSYNYCGPLYSFIEDGKATKTKASDNTRNYRKQLQKSPREALVSECHIIKDEKSDSSSVIEVPLSPESQKKELCSYLQLMNPADKKEIFILQNRRSTRVKNLSLKQEKKELEKKLKENNNSDEDFDKYPTLKSFKDLHLEINEEKDCWLSLDNMRKEFAQNFFQFPIASKKVTDCVHNFDDCMNEIIQEFTEDKNIVPSRFKIVKTNVKELKKYTEKEGKDLCKNDLLKANGKYKSETSTQQKNLQRNKENRSRTLRKMMRGRTNISTNNFRNTVKKSEKVMNRKNIAEPYVNKLRRCRMQQNAKTQTSIVKKKLKHIKKKIPKIETPAESINEPPNIEIKLSPKTLIIPRPKSMPALSRCDMVTATPSSTDDQIDMQNFMDDIIDFNNLTEEHKKCLFETRILSSKPIDPNTPRISNKSVNSTSALSPLYGFPEENAEEVKRIWEQTSEERKIEAKTPALEPIKETFVENKEEKCEKSQLPSEELHFQTNILTNPIDLLTELENKYAQTTLDSIENYANSDMESENSLESEVETTTNGITLDHDYADTVINNEENSNSTKKNCEKLVPETVVTNLDLVQFDKNNKIEIKSLHRSLLSNKRKYYTNTIESKSSQQDWVTDSPTQKQRKNKHSIYISKADGAILKAFYFEYNLIICQQHTVSFWTQTALGNVLGSQNMWIPKGHIQRLVLNNECIQKESMEMLVSTENHMAYIELWTKEHKSDIRERPVADVFTTIYFWKQNRLDKKVLQLENIKGFADDVQYSVLKYAPKIIVSWHRPSNDLENKQTFIHCYDLANDYQTVANIREIEPVDHYVSSLHNIEDGDSLIMGCGENKITLWNIDYGYIVATIEMTEIKSPLSTLWVKCDRGFLFTLQQCVDKELRLIAINGRNHTWKKLASYVPPDSYDRLKGVCVENGIIVSFYDQGILCWNAQTGSPIMEEKQENETDYIPSGKYVILVVNDQIVVKHAITYLITADDI